LDPVSSPHFRSGLGLPAALAVTAYCSWHGRLADLMKQIMGIGDQKVKEYRDG
jgi:hypothetical protein